MNGTDISVFTSPEILTKALSIVDGRLRKSPGGHMTTGQVKRETVHTPADLAGVVQGLTTHQALGFGLCQYPFAIIAAQGRLDKIPPNSSTPTIARTAQNFTFAKGQPGILMLDVDPPKDGTPPLTRAQALDLMASVWPGAARAPVVICDSASSHIWNGETGEELIGARGLRLYIFVADAADIPRAGQVLFKKAN